ncbi:type II toxin-antitoxin system Phd/YefM family antitoxin [Acinetobacter puyangensis]|uniref:type II toxin-antitoxin system Phd/YefM family antitoxin n=1 Tax=Acinetobacter puyangensis TaxID=1096779 RepID=UPI003A4DAF5C
MELIKITDAKAHFSALLQRVEAGEEIAIARRGKIIARLIPEKKHNISVAEALQEIWDLGGLTLDEMSDDTLPALDHVNLD